MEEIVCFIRGILVKKKMSKKLVSIKIIVNKNSYSNLKKLKYIKTGFSIFSSADCVSTMAFVIPEASNLLFINKFSR